MKNLSALNVLFYFKIRKAELIKNYTISIGGFFALLLFSGITFLVIGFFCGLSILKHTDLIMYLVLTLVGVIIVCNVSFLLCNNFIDRKRKKIFYNSGK